MTDAVRQEIYDIYTEKPEDWSSRKLATKFGISMRRVEAVLKLKEAEKQMEMDVSERIWMLILYYAETGLSIYGI